MLKLGENVETSDAASVAAELKNKLWSVAELDKNSNVSFTSSTYGGVTNISELNPRSLNTGLAVVVVVLVTK